MIEINYDWLDHLWSHFEYDAGDINSTSISSSEDIDILVHFCVRPAYVGFSELAQKRLKETWRYAIDKGSDATLYFNPANFSIDMNIRRLHQECWNRMFPGESWHVNDAGVYHEICFHMRVDDE